MICAIAGGSGAGKTTLAFKLLDLLGDSGDHIAVDWYYRDLSHITMAERKLVNYDHPDSLEVELFAQDLDFLKDGVDVEAPTYDFATHTRLEGTVTVRARPCVVTEGILLLALEDVRDRYDYSVFIDVPDALRLERRLRRDTVQRGRSEDDIVRQWDEFVRPMHRDLVLPSMAFADRVVAHDEDLDAVAQELADRVAVAS